MSENVPSSRPDRSSARARHEAPSAPITGRTTPDAAVEIFQQILRTTPWLIIAALLGFGMYKGAQLVFNAKEKAEEEYAARLKSANDNLLNAYEKIGTMSEQLIRNVSELLLLQDKATTNAELQQAKLLQMQETTRQQIDLADKARRASEEAEQKSRQFTEAAEKARQEAELAKVDVDRLNKAKEEMDRQLKLTKGNLESGVENISDLKSNLQFLVEKILDPFTPAEEELVVLAGALRGRYVENPLKSLTAFATNTVPEEAARLRLLVGTTLEVLQAEITNITGYAFWARAGTPESPDEATFFGALRQGPNHWEHGVRLRVRERRVVAVDVFRWIGFVRAPLPTDWHRTNTWAVVDDELLDEIHVTAGMSPEDLLEGSAGTMTVSGLVGRFHLPVPMDPATLMASHKDVYDRAARQEDYTLFTLANMQSRARNFDASRLNLDNVPSHHRSTVIRALNAAVLRDTDPRNILAPRAEPTTLGRLGAFVLRGEALQFNYNRPDDPTAQQAVQSNIPNLGYLPLPPGETHWTGNKLSLTLRHRSETGRMVPADLLFVWVADNPPELAYFSANYPRLGYARE